MPVERNPPTLCKGRSTPILDEQFHPNGRRITEWDRAQERKRQALEIKQTLFSPKPLTSADDSPDSPVSVRNSDLQELAKIAQNLHELLDGLSSRDMPWMRDMGEGAEEAVSPVRRLTTTLPELSHRPTRPTRPGWPNSTPFPFGSCVEDLFSHSFQPPPRKGGWFWIQKSEVLAADAARFPAKKSEIKRFGHTAQRIQPVTERKVDSRSFAEVTMERRPQQGRGGVNLQQSRDEERRANERGSGFPRQRFGGSDGDRRYDFNRGVDGHSSKAGRHGFPAYGGRADNFVGGEDVFQGAKGVTMTGGTHVFWVKRICATSLLVIKIVLMAGRVNPRPSAEMSEMWRNLVTKPFAIDAIRRDLRSECTNPPICYNCKESGHMSASCPQIKVNKGLKLCGFGLPGQMFYSLQIPLEEEAENLKPNVGVMVIREGVGSVSKVTTELRYLRSSTWDWKVKKIANGRYEFVAPSKPDLDFLIKFTEFQCKSSDLKVSGLPNWARQQKTIEEIAFLVGDPLLVDTKSLVGSGPVRVKAMCKDPAEIGGSNTVYLNGSGFKLSWKVEKKIEETKEVDAPDLQDEEDDEEDEKSDSYNPLLEEFANPSSGKATGLGPEQNSQSETHKSRTSESQGKHRGVDLGQNEFSDGKDCELQASAVDIAEQNELIKTQVLVFSADRQELTEEDAGDSLNQNFSVDADGETRCKMMVANPLLDVEVVDSQPMQEDQGLVGGGGGGGASEQSGLEQEVEVEPVIAPDLAVQSFKSAEVDDKKLSAPLMATRESKRAKGSGTPTHIRAERKMAASFSEADMAAGCGIVMGEDSVAINKHLDRLKAREVAQAALTLAARILADQSDKPVDEEEDLEEDVPLNEDHIRLVESVLEEDHVLPSEVDLFGNPTAEGKDNNKDRIMIPD
ncbi:hypothetical protein C2845_PM07G07000 [Panicum miliaceum]|uniref:CCHC-type domain-containing protein n=1 Tax=Panicum miliaceum TaxID=4540 RepID=A0A3L6SSJ6_PANMI|nr:hypothetical protein C2845_PM07G07000 [Panicum miliaceum]